MMLQRFALKVLLLLASRRISPHPKVCHRCQLPMTSLRQHLWIRCSIDLCAEKGCVGSAVLGAWRSLATTIGDRKSWLKYLFSWRSLTCRCEGVSKMPNATTISLIAVQSINNSNNSSKRWHSWELVRLRACVRGFVCGGEWGRFRCAGWLSEEDRRHNVVYFN